ncbi:protein kinase family protein with ARM repeat domain [Striga asiatica]|uniref:Protein kinase family protein with ARM repeat domain n=1 Tax=Striga asiatica TaxID=4170 RepID=A0A5A7PSA5_STRAF|nr:protein kinase family protein with ARM repeat domain [Striga asiatica]
MKMQDSTRRDVESNFSNHVNWDEDSIFDGEDDGRYYDNLNEEANVHENDSKNEDETEQLEQDNKNEDINDGRDYDDFNGEANVHENDSENDDEIEQLEKDNENEDIIRRKSVNIHNVPPLNLSQNETPNEDAFNESTFRWRNA